MAERQPCEACPLLIAISSHDTGASTISSACICSLAGLGVPIPRHSRARETRGQAREPAPLIRACCLRSTPSSYPAQIPSRGPGAFAREVLAVRGKPVDDDDVHRDDGYCYPRSRRDVEEPPDRAHAGDDQAEDLADWSAPQDVVAGIEGDGGEHHIDDAPQPEIVPEH